MGSRLGVAGEAVPAGAPRSRPVDALTQACGEGGHRQKVGEAAAAGNEPPVLDAADAEAQVYARAANAFGGRFLPSWLNQGQTCAGAAGRVKARSMTASGASTSSSPGIALAISPGRGFTRVLSS